MGQKIRHHLWMTPIGVFRVAFLYFILTILLDHQFRAFVRIGAVAPIDFEKELQMATMNLGMYYTLALVN